ncbi:MAG: DUF4139 domain-containing protein [Planctomycetes bacterium]|nr:DUF4139 domain-containing protein [Planctomycetota bacterium]
MRNPYLTALIGSMLTCGSAAADDESVALTIYSTARPGAIPASMYQPAMRGPQAYGAYQSLTLPGYAIVKQQRTIQLKAGRNDLRFTDVAAMIEPTTVLFSSLTDPSGTTVLEQSFEFDLVSPQKLLERFIDKPISLTFIRPNGDVDEISGVLLSSDGRQMVLRTDDPTHPIQILQSPAARVNLSELPGGLITRPTLVWDLSAKQAGEHLIRVTYETKAMTWWADYNMVYSDSDDPNRGSFDLGAWVSIINQSGASYQDAKLKLIAGDVQRAAPPQMEMRKFAMAGRAAGIAGDGFKEKAFFEYHLYTLGRPTTLPNNSTKQIELFPTVRGVPCEKVYLYYGMPVSWGYGAAANAGRELGIPMNKKVDVYLRFRNDAESGLGMPLPSGRVRVNKLDPADETLEFIGENTIDHTPKDEEVLIKLGSAFDVVGERRRTSFRSDKNRHTIDESFEIKVRNHKDATITVIVKETLYRWSGWEIRAKSHPFEKIDSRTIHIPVRVKPGGEATVTYSVHYEW